jgi:hypothetical protein
VVDIRRVSGEFWTMAILRRGLAWHGELGSVIFIEIHFQVKEIGAAGVDQAQVKLRPMWLCSICCEISEEKSSGRSAWARWME